MSFPSERAFSLAFPSRSTIGLKPRKVRKSTLKSENLEINNKNNRNEEVRKGAEAARRVVAEVERESKVPLPSLIDALMEKRQENAVKERSKQRQ